MGESHRRTGYVDHAPRRPSGEGDIDGSGDVDGVGLVVTGLGGHQRGEMNHRVVTLHHRSDLVRIANIPEHFGTFHGAGVTLKARDLVTTSE